MKIVLVYYPKGKTLEVGKHSFDIVNNNVKPNEDKRKGSLYYNELSEYEKAYCLAQWAWEHQLFDSIEDNR